ncbi:MAG: sugar ABC transporter permease [Ruminococcus sp.]|nr:sugar ABC transporter permease [Ruminococcus sp.]
MKLFKSYKFRRILLNTIIYIILGIMCIIWVSPFIYLMLHSFRADGGVVTNDAVLPHRFTFQHYIELFAPSTDTSLNFPRWFMNTFVVACFSCVISTISVLAVSYAFSRLRFGIRKKLMNIAMILGMFPGFMTMIAIYYLLKIMGLDGNLIALVLCYSCGAGLGFQISKGFFDTIPRALDEAATIDGATKNQIFWKIILPMSKPIVVYTILTAFIGPWTDFILAKIIMGDKHDNYTVAIGLQMMKDPDHMTQWFQEFLAGSVVVAIPITLLFLKMQKYYVEGVTAGGVKG